MGKLKWTHLISFIILVNISFQSDILELPTAQVVNNQVLPNQYLYYTSPIEPNRQGEIYINFKRGTGMLLAAVSFDGSTDILPTIESNNLIPFNSFENKVYVLSNYTDKCSEKCRLIIGVYSEDKYSDSVKDLNYKVEFLLFFKYFGASYVKIPLNEYITRTSKYFIEEEVYFGNDYYEIEVPDDTKEILFELQSEDRIAEIRQGTNNSMNDNIWTTEENNDVLRIAHEINKGKIYRISLQALGTDYFEYSRYSFKVTALKENQPNYNTITTDEISFCPKNKENLCNFLLPVSKEDKLDTLLFFANSFEYEKHQDFDIFVNIISEKEEKIFPTIEKNKYNNLNQLDKQYLLIKDEVLLSNEKSFILISVHTKEVMSFKFMSSFRKGIVSQFLYPNTRLYFLNKDETLVLKARLEHENFSIRPVRVFGKGKAQVVIKDEIISENEINYGANNLVIASTAKLPIQSIKFTALEDLFVFYITYNIRAKDNFDEALSNQKNTFLTYESQIPVSFYIKIPSNLDEYTFNVNIVDIVATSNTAFDSNYKIRGKIVHRDFIAKKRMYPEFDMASMEYIEGEYDPSLRIGTIHIDKESMDKAVEIFGDSLYFYAKLERVRKIPKQLQRKDKLVVIETALIPSSSFSTNYDFPYGTFFTSNLMFQEKIKLGVSYFKLPKKKEKDKYITIEIANARFLRANFTLNTEINQDFTLDENLLKNATDIKILSVTQKDGKLNIKSEIPEGKNNIILTVFSSPMRDGMIIQSPFLLKYQTSEKEIENLLPNQKKIESFEIKKKKLSVKIKPIYNAKGNLEGEYIMRIISLNDGRGISHMNSILSFLNPLRIYRVKTNKIKNGIIEFEDDNYTIQGSVYASVIGILKDNNGETVTTLYETYLFEDKKMNIPPWISFAVIGIILSLLIGVICLYRSFRRMQDKLYGKVTAVEKDIFDIDTNYGPLG